MRLARRPNDTDDWRAGQMIQMTGAQAKIARKTGAQAVYNECDWRAGQMIHMTGAQAE